MGEGFMADLPGVLALLFIGAGIGVMIFFGALVAPTAFRTLGEETAGPFIRTIFPIYHVIFIALGALATISAWLAGARIGAVLLALVTAGFVYGRFALSPAMDKARASKDKQRFAALHQRSMLINLAQLAGFIVALALIATRF
ncbi:hypothetical protein DDZ18_00770 [Marinicauda salina]|uniref:TMEM205-like domain-containing protein n=1 Tax=Marinicauda salina TaxID=2135793 RepID=A0A2U2BVZ3_9PROT|nr:DUF4149 domain-containing protein [Marinicauda salina]PWE18178.1 hypothetical protein DDZ18_00770 [Marinicauda salina]